jgi:hypothetical protein
MDLYPFDSHICYVNITLDEKQAESIRWQFKKRFSVYRVVMAEIFLIIIEEVPFKRKLLVHWGMGKY